MARKAVPTGPSCEGSFLDICSSGIRLGSEDRCAQEDQRGYFSLHPRPPVSSRIYAGWERLRRRRDGFEACMWVMEVGPWV
ncbi:hypothetical protein I79_007922 [Cricetulus griseus]|uniref:Uncharacterized protein n=1 Tax=Cricetulus griseus TaxID=10029 RepID=G3HBX1_CRIGR|nr:hypothetical protein I79_007922 [Cricetulus griseus]